MIPDLSSILVINGKVLGIEWSFWKVLGWVGNGIFFSRFIIQWIATERSRKVVVPLAFWYCSLLGSLCLLIYAVHQRDSVFIGAYIFTWVPYGRNLYFALKEKGQVQTSESC
jgi:lipid-A-disaccharide synthase-like uncharacterized protein